jgi:glutamate N-acetyltransferase / amino-acid N-acetyltransferase
MSKVLPPLFPVPGIRLGVAQAHIRKPNRDDVLVVAIDQGAQVAGVFTQNTCCAAPVTVCREHLSRGAGRRALLVNTGCANAATGQKGLDDARRSTEIVAEVLGCGAKDVLPFSTGVIMEHLSMDRLEAGIRAAAQALHADQWTRAASAIMTTDTRPKGASEQITLDGQTITITGISKGSGMIHPNMATLLGFMATDATIGADLLRRWVKRLADASFNRITVDGDTSTNDSFVLISTGASQQAPIEDENDPRAPVLWASLSRVAISIAKAIVLDGEGATKFITIQVEGAHTESEAVQIAKSIAHSPLVKTAFFASDPNLGRIACAIGYAPVEALNFQHVDVYLDDVLVIENGGRAASYQEAEGQRVMNQADITIRVHVKQRGTASATVWTCDFSHDYVTINAEYRS